MTDEIQALKSRIAWLEDELLAAAAEARRSPGSFGRSIVTAVSGRAVHERRWRLTDELAASRAALRKLEAQA